MAIARPVLVDSTNVAAMVDAPMSPLRTRMMGPAKKASGDAYPKAEVQTSRGLQLEKGKGKQKEKERARLARTKAPLESVDENDVQAQVQMVTRQKLRRKPIV